MDLSTRSIRVVATATAAVALVALPATAATAGEREHTVHSGETVWGIAKRYGSTVESIVEANNLNARAVIHPGQRLTIPDAGGSSQLTAAATHRVVKGDTVWDLARRYGTTVDAIVAANGLGPAAMIRIGTVLTIPGATPGSAPNVATDTNLASFGGTGGTYTVKAGDTMYDLAKRFGTTVTAIAQANGIKNPAVIRIGQSLTIPGGTPTGLVGDTFLGRTYAAPVVAAANQNKATLNAMDVPTRGQMQQLVIRIARDMGVDPALAQAVAYQESGFNQRAVSPANAIGCMQVIPTSGEWASDLVGRDLNLLIAEDNVTAGVAILKVLQRNGTELDIALAGYYQGETSVRKRGMNADTVTYVASVKALMARFD